MVVVVGQFGERKSACHAAIVAACGWMVCDSCSCDTIENSRRLSSLADKPISEGFRMEPEPSKTVLPKDCQFSIDLPAHIQDIIDPQLKQRASDAWKATMTVLRGIELFEKWIVELEQNGDAHPSVPRRLLVRIDFALGSLCRSGIDLDDFQPDREEELWASFPGPVDAVTSFNDGDYEPPGPPRLGPFAPWQIRYRSEYREKRRLWRPLEGRLRAVIELLKFPSTTFRKSLSQAPDGRERLRELATQVTKLEHKILDYLWGGIPVVFDKFHQDVWADRPTQVGSAHKAIDRLNTKLCELGHHGIEIKDANGMVQLILAPDK
jgi:hypothetical protein